MDYEKKYNEALERARIYRDVAEIVEDYAAIARYEIIFPELRKSEDERINKAIFKALSKKEARDVLLAEGVQVSEALDYLKKQEQKPAEKQDYSGLNDLERAIHRGFLCAGVENVPVTIIEETAQDCLAQMKSAEWSEEDEHRRQQAINALDRNGYYVLVDWLKSLRPQPKQEWSKGDELKLGAIITDIETRSDITESIKNKYVSFLKSLRPSWKPSEEQMKVFQNTMQRLLKAGGIGKWYAILESLYEQLKKL